MADVPLVCSSMFSYFRCEENAACVLCVCVSASLTFVRVGHFSRAKFTWRLLINAAYLLEDVLNMLDEMA